MTASQRSIRGRYVASAAFVAVEAIGCVAHDRVVDLDRPQVQRVWVAEPVVVGRMAARP